MIIQKYGEIMVVITIDLFVSQNLRPSPPTCMRPCVYVYIYIYTTHTYTHSIYIYIYTVYMNIDIRIYIQLLLFTL